MAQHDIGLIGLAVMGQNLVLNMANHGFSVGVYNRTTATTDEFVASLKTEPADKVHPGTVDRIRGYHKLKDFVASLKAPRRVMIMVKAGGPVDAVIEQLKPLMSPGDIFIDGGNSDFRDTNRRHEDLKQAGFRFIGTGVSGGEEGALKGPSIMPGGHHEAWPFVKDVFQAISAKVGEKNDVPCCDWVGEAGAGHYVKMVHNGIEYADMQLIGEAYHLLRTGLDAEPAELGDIFSHWNEGDLDSFLIEITADILRQRDPVTGGPFVDVVLDAAGQKGTGKWTAGNALDLGIPAMTIAEAVFARSMSALKHERLVAAEVLGGPDPEHAAGRIDDRQAYINAVRDALYCSKICAYAQGFQLMAAAQQEYRWTLNFGEIAKIWRGGCIIRARFLQKITEAYERNPQLTNLLLDPYFRQQIDQRQHAWRHVTASAVMMGLPAPAFTSSLAYYDSYRSPTLPANLLQAQRDYFGAHTYERTDQPRGKFFHIDWLHPQRPQVQA
jgi:6-phosphogluconate dehydrogenase